MRKTVSKTKFKSNEGITLIALVITIIVLLILAGVAISMLSGENGILKQAAKAKTETEKKSTLEQIRLATMSAMTNPEHKIKSAGDLLTALQQQGLNNIGDVKESAPVGYIAKIGDVEYRITESGDVSPIINLVGNQGKILNENENTLVKDEFGNIIVVPAGFGIVTGENVNNASNATQGIVITDKFENGESKGNEFVWIPVGKVYMTADEVKTETNTKTITMARYVFNSDGSINADRTQTDPNGKLYTLPTITSTSNYYTDSKAGAFKTSAVKNGGYYIGRYEAGIDGTTHNSSLPTKTAVDGSVKPQSKKNKGVWNAIKQSDASKVSQAMYSDSNFTSDLINSYAWDTAIVFIQKMKDDLSYASMSGKSKTNTSAPQTTGTNILNQTSAIDEQCNIYDMAGNVMEWSTETCSDSSYPCVYRGGYYYFYSYNFTCTRNNISDLASPYEGFRPLLYVM